MPFVHQIADEAAARLVTVDTHELLFEVAAHLHAGTDMVVACDNAGRLLGIITKTDLVSCLARKLSLGEQTTVAVAVKRDVTTCSLSDELHQLWETMKAHDFKSIPIVDADRRPLGIATARDVLAFLLSATENDEELLQNYVMGLGYR